MKVAQFKNKSPLYLIHSVFSLYFHESAQKHWHTYVFHYPRFPLLLQRYVVMHLCHYHYDPLIQLLMTTASSLLANLNPLCLCSRCLYI